MKPRSAVEEEFGRRELKQVPSEVKPARKDRKASKSPRVYVQDYAKEDGAYVRPDL